MPLEDDFKAALASWPSGISVVTTNDDGLLYGLTVSSFSSLSLEPPLILVCVANENRMPAMVERSGRFAVSVLAQGQEGASRYFARTGRVPTADFVEIEGEWTGSGLPVIKGALCWLVCRLRQLIPQGDHVVVVGEVTESSTRADGAPLLYWRRGYRSLAN